jgi:crotonobetainyl-CoA:carnitine CoA-transferase CaiB-like acyl-CoA transferase
MQISSNSPAKGPLAGIRVIDCTSILFGPYCTQLLGDMGADVIKVEGPEGDTIRDAGTGRSPGMSGVFVNTNRNKRSIVVDMKTAESKAIMADLLKTADVFVSNIRRKGLGRLGLDHESLRESHPRLIHCSATGYGRGGPYEDKPAFDDTIQAISGLASLQTAFCGEPRYVASAVADKISGLTLALAIVAAIRHRDVTGETQQVEVSMFETMVAFNMLEHLSGLAFDPPTGPAVYPRTVSPHRRPYRTADGYLAVMPYNDGHWQRFFKLIGQPKLASDPRFESMSSRTKNVDALYGMVADEMRKHSTAYWQQALLEQDIPVVPVKKPEELLTDEHLLARGFIQRVQHPTEGGMVTMASPMELSVSPLSVNRLAPNLGEHTEEILEGLGYGRARIDALIEGGSIQTWKVSRPS